MSRSPLPLVLRLAVLRLAGRCLSTALPLLSACDSSSAGGGRADARSAVGDGGVTRADGDTPGGSGVPAAGAPRVRGARPDRAPLAGGVRIRLEGANLGAVTTVRFGATAAEITDRTETTLDVMAPPAAEGGPVSLELTAPEGEAVFRGFRYYGIAATALRFIEVPGGADTAEGERVFTLRTPLAPRVVVQRPGLLVTLEPGAGGRLVHKSEAEAPPMVQAACVADFDADAREDLFLADADGTAGVFRQDGPGLSLPTPLAGVPARHAVCADFTGDENPDVLVVLAPAEGMPALQLLVGDGHGGLAPAAGGRTLGSALVVGLAAADFDADGHLDVLLGLAEGAPRLLTGDGGGGFSDALPGTLPAGAGRPGGGASEAPNGAVPLVADFDGDSTPDVFLLGTAGASLWLNDGEGHLTDRSGLNVGVPGLSAPALSALDIDLDGATDILAVGLERTLLLRNDGHGRLFDYSTSLVARRGAGGLLSATAVDLDGDHDLELVGLRAGAPEPVIFRNWAPLPYTDPDADGLPDALDNCPAVPNADQENRDAAHFLCATPEACLAATGCALLEDVPANRAWLLCPAQALSSTDAADFCGRLGGQLWSPRSAEEQLRVAALGPGQFWLDLSDAAAEGTFVTSAGLMPPFSAWGEGQPDNAGAGEHCVELITNEPAAPVWNDLPCEVPIGVVCEDQAHEDDGLGDACDPCPDDADPLAACPAVVP